MEKENKHNYYLMVILLASVVGLISLYPHAFLTYKYGFTGYDKALQTDEHRYSARVTNPYNDPHIWEKKDDPTPMEMLPVRIFSLFERAIGIENTLILWDFLGPFLCVFTFFLAIRFSLHSSKSVLTKQEFIIVLIGILGTCFFSRSLRCFDLIGASVIDYLYHRSSDILGNQWYRTLICGSANSRIFYPALNLPLFLLSLGCLIKCWREQRTRILFAVITGILSGLSIYVRIYDYGVLAGILFVLFLTHLASVPFINRALTRSQSPKWRLGLFLIAGYLLFGPVYIGIFYRLTPEYLKIIGYLVAGCLVLFFFVGYQRNCGHQEPGNLKNLLIIAGIFLVISLPRVVFLVFYRFQHPEFLEGNIVQEGTTFFQRHSPNRYSISYGLFLFILLFLIERLIGDMRQRRQLGTILQIPVLICAGAIIGWNLQIITGQNLDPQHYQWHYIAPMNAFIVAVVVFYGIFTKWKSKSFNMAFLWLFLCSGFVFQILCIYDSNDHKQYMLDSTQYKVSQWVAEHTEKDSVIATNYYPPTVVMNTKRFSFIPYLTYSLITLDELCERYLLLQGLLGDDLNEFFTKKAPRVQRYYRQRVVKTPHKTYLASILAIRSLKATQESLDKFEFFKGHSQEWFLQNILDKYKCDYLIITPVDAERFPDKLLFFEENPHFKKVFSDGEALVYKIERVQ